MDKNEIPPLLTQVAQKEGLVGSLAKVQSYDVRLSAILNLFHAVAPVFLGPLQVRANLTKLAGKCTLTWATCNRNCMHRGKAQGQGAGLVPPATLPQPSW